MKGRDVVQKSFVGIAVHIADDSTFDVVWLRPSNFRETSNDWQYSGARIAIGAHGSLA